MVPSSNKSLITASEISLVCAGSPWFSQMRPNILEVQAVKAFATLPQFVHQRMLLCTNFMESTPPSSKHRTGPCTTFISGTVSISPATSLPFVHEFFTQEIPFVCTRLSAEVQAATSHRQQEWLFKLHRIRLLARHPVRAVQLENVRLSSSTSVRRISMSQRFPNVGCAKLKLHRSCRFQLRLVSVTTSVLAGGLKQFLQNSLSPHSKSRLDWKLDTAHSFISCDALTPQRPWFLPLAHRVVSQFPSNCSVSTNFLVQAARH